MPAIAMGIPTIFIAHKRMRADYRIHIIDELIGIHYVRTLCLSRFFYRHQINWHAKSVDIEKLKHEIKNKFKSHIEQCLSKKGCNIDDDYY